MSELYDRYRLYFMLERKNERNNQFQHTSHLLSDGVLRARPQAGQFLPVPRGGTSSVVEDYTSLSHSFRAFEAYTAERCFTYRKVPPIR